MHCLLFKIWKHTVVFKGLKSWVLSPNLWSQQNNDWISENALCLVGVPAASWILLADSQKLSFSTLIMRPISVFWSAKLSRQGRPSLGIDGHDPILKKFTFLRSLPIKTVQNMYPPACSDKKISKVGTPNA